MLSQILRVSKLVKDSQAFEQILTELSTCYNFEYFLSKLEKNLRRGNTDILSELICAYRLKKHAGLRIGFLPEKHYKSEKIQIVPGYQAGNISDKTPDIWVINNGDWLCVEVKRLKFQLEKSEILRAAFDPNFPHEAESEKTTKRIIGAVTDSIEQIGSFGKGYVYIECERAKLNFDNVERRLQDIFNKTPELLGVIIVQYFLKIDDVITKPEIKIFLNST